ncbi:hypothetical protein CHLRE_03g193050v5 [Chlamydomonas reinhardtii]|uniref:Uncharacterized protein n=1 Tax=Chlamydomonas reinhardtii TaxID=3055 RepID=A0A2K3DYG2_CHLRE|nr:uncharacterized protein CHLRE_03g193050v5 [Chlamydomonas reinhardtii]PNW85571.1 hypothetical protein CHLRE_03g193050v5 [Chlamydomonas reinhardtii]
MELALNRDLLHSQFSSWRLQPLASVKRHDLELYGHAAGIVSSSVDFLHTQASVTRNHVLQSEGRLFVFTQQDGSAAHRVFELLPVPNADAGLLPMQVAELTGGAGAEAVGGSVEAVLDCSLAVVAPHAQQPAQQEPGAGAAGTTTGAAPTDRQQPSQYESARPFQVLLSRGHGDLVLVRVPAGGGGNSGGNSGGSGSAAQMSNPVFPVRPRAPLAGVRPVTLEAAVEHANGDITAVVWAIRSRGASTPGCCELFAVTLRPGVDAEGRLRLETLGVQLLLRTKLAPYVVRVYAAAAGAAPVAVVGFDPNTAGLEEEDEEDASQAPGPSGKPSVAAMEAAAAADDAANAPPAAGDDDDDMDPRTLEQAVARLAHLTSSERDKAVPLAQWADLYKESGPDGVGAMGGEPVLDLAAWRLGGGAGGSTDKTQRPYWRLSCHAHRLLTADGPLRAPAAATAAARPALLLGVTDDVDCAVVRLDVGAQGAGGDAGASDPAPQVTHAVSIPALAYVAAGKTYKRHLLLGSAGTGCSSGSASSSGAGGVLSAVLVESQRFMYVYGFTSSREEYGRQQVVELGLEEGESVLGARLVEVAAAQGTEGGPGAGGALVVVATQRRLLSYRLTWR